MSTPLVELVSRAARPRILVVGDVMLDRYLIGDVERISPEGPIPVLRVAREEHRLGGAGSVAAMLAALGADVQLTAVVGDDPEGGTVRRLLGEIEVDADAVLAAPGRSTTVKERLLGRTHSRHPQQMVRVDREETGPIDGPLCERLLRLVAERLGGLDLLLVSDYAKGVCAGDFIPRLVELARAAGLPVVADPVRGADYTRYAGCRCITPNRTETATALSRAIDSPGVGLEAARELLRFGVEAAMVTLDRDGIAWADAAGNAALFPVKARQVYDITGAGDMVLAAVGYALAAGADWRTAVELANLAGGMEVQRLGVQPITRHELLAELARGAYDPGQKILPLDGLLVELRRRRAAGQTVAMTNGCFDLLHPGHVASLEAARRHGDLLVVGLNSDRSVRELKGPGHPIVDERGRAEMLAALACVDYVVLFDEPSVYGLIERVLPDVLVKSAQYAHDEVVGHEVVERHGGRVVRVPMKRGYSTSRLLERLRGRAPVED